VPTSSGPSSRPARHRGETRRVRSAAFTVQRVDQALVAEAGWRPTGRGRQAQQAPHRRRRGCRHGRVGCRRAGRQPTRLSICARYGPGSQSSPGAVAWATLAGSLAHRAEGHGSRVRSTRPSTYEGNVSDAVGVTGEQANGPGIGGIYRGRSPPSCLGRIARGRSAGRPSGVTSGSRRAAERSFPSCTGPAQARRGAKRPPPSDPWPPLWLRACTAIWLPRWPGHARPPAKPERAAPTRGAKAGTRPHSWTGYHMKRWPDSSRYSMRRLPSRPGSCTATHPPRQLQLTMVERDGLGR
jgi:hypothetical protein